MVKYGMREALEMFEMIRDSACIIDHFTDYISHCQDPALRQILENQQRHLVEGYNNKINVIQGAGLDITGLPRIQPASLMRRGQDPGTAGVHSGSNIQFGTQQNMGQSNVQTLPDTMDDRTIAQGALIFHKAGAVRANSAALESADPQLRNMAVNSVHTCTDMAYEIFRYMSQRGLYQMPQLPGGFSETHSRGMYDYQVAPQKTAGMQQNFAGTQQNNPGPQQNYPGPQQHRAGHYHTNPGHIS